jgi:dipeptidase E
MKFFLSSAGLTTEALVDSFLKLAEIPQQELRVAYIPTAAEHIRQSGVEEGVAPFISLGAKVVVIDISLEDVAVWMPKLLESNVLCFGGGSEFRLMEYINRTGLSNELSDLLKTRIWVGVSAGSMVTNPTLYGSASHTLYEESPATQANFPGLGFLPFQYLPHLNSPDFPKLLVENIECIAQDIPVHIYSTDDETALSVSDGVVTIVGTGMCREWNVHK